MNLVYHTPPFTMTDNCRTVVNCCGVNIKKKYTEDAFFCFIKSIIGNIMFNKESKRYFEF